MAKTSENAGQNWKGQLESFSNQIGINQEYLRYKKDLRNEQKINKATKSCEKIWFYKENRVSNQKAIKNK